MPIGVRKKVRKRLVKLSSITSEQTENDLKIYIFITPLLALNLLLK